MIKHKYFNDDEHIQINNIILERYKSKNFNYEKKKFDDLIKLAKERIINDKNKDVHDANAREMTRKYANN